MIRSERLWLRDARAGIAGVAAFLVLGGGWASTGAGAEATPGVIAFVARNGKQSDIYVIRADGTGRRQLTHGPAFESCPSWSPDGKTIAFLVPAALGSFSAAIEVVTNEGRRLWRLPVGDGGAVACPFWSPDGSRLAFWRYEKVYAVGSNGRGTRKLAELSTSNAAWSPDGKELAFVQDAGEDLVFVITVVRADGHGHRVIRAKPTGWCTSACHLYHGLVSWAPGKLIAFVMAEGDNYPERLYAIRSDATGQRLLSGKLQDVYGSAWSPDRTRIAFEATGAHNLTYIWTSKADGSGVRQLVKRASAGPSWSPDGEQIAYSADARIYIVDADTGKQRLLVRQARGHASWQPRP